VLESSFAKAGAAAMNAILRIAAWIIAVMLVTAPIVAVLNGWIGGVALANAASGRDRRIPLGQRSQVRDAVLPAVRDGFFSPCT
jgi:cell division protein FtsQ